MKKVIISLVLGSMLAFGGCSTLTGEGSLITRVQTAAKLAAYVGTSEYVREHPETKLAFVVARDQLFLIENSEHVDLTLFLSIVNQLPVKELKSERAQLIITGATIILTDFADRLPIEKLDDLKPVAKSIREGIDLALAQRP